MSSKAVPTIDPMTAFGRAVKATRIEKGVTQEALADICDMSRPQLSKVETGQADLRLTSVFRLAAGLDMYAADLIQRAEQIIGASHKGRS